MKTRLEKSSEHMPWEHGKPNGYLFESEPLVINATKDIVWKLVKDINHYADYSKGAITAVIDGDPVKDKTLTMELYKGQPLGCLIPASTEKINKVDDEEKILGWKRELPDGSVTERYQVLKSTEDGKTVSYIALSIPGAIGFFTQRTLKKSIEKAFNQLGDGIKQIAEEQETTQKNTY